MKDTYKKKITFFELTSVNIINSTFPTFIFLVLVLNNKLISAADLVIVSSFTILVSKIFSLNLRNIFIAKYKKKKINHFIFLRFIFSFFISVLSLTFIYLFLNSQNDILYLIILVFVFQWMIELNLVKVEIENKINKIFTLFIVNILIIISILISSFLYEFNYFNEILIAYIAYLFYFYVDTIEFKKIKFNLNFLNELRHMFSKSITSHTFLSSFFLNFANLIWRILIVYYVGKNISSIIFFFYSIGSFPATIFNSSFGPTMVKNKINSNRLFLFFIFYLLLVFTSFYIAYFIFEIISLNLELSKNFILNIFIFSLLGSILMLYSAHFRQIKINSNPNFNNNIFLKDILVSFGIIIIVPILYNLGKVDYLAFSYFFASLISITVYSSISKK
jgi:hypothetical protein